MDFEFRFFSLSQLLAALYTLIYMYNVCQCNYARLHTNHSLLLLLYTQYILTVALTIQIDLRVIYPLHIYFFVLKTTKQQTFLRLLCMNCTLIHLSFARGYSIHYRVHGSLYTNTARKTSFADSSSLAASKSVWLLRWALWRRQLN